MRARIMAVMVAALSALTMLLTATPASAVSFDLVTAFNPDSQHNGRAEANGNIAYFGPRGADISAWITDTCPADGYGAYARLRVVFKNGGVGYTGWIWKQDDGCSNSVYYVPDLFTTSDNIDYIQVHLCERDYSGGQWHTGDCKYSHNKDNPYT